jgi:protein-S-isoprenylcysteine O-methyltransferase Ste14
MDENGNDMRAGDRGMRIHPPVVAGGLLLAGLLLHLLGFHHHHYQHMVHFHQLLGLLFVAGGVGLSFYAAAIFAARGTTKDPYGEPAALVTTMPFTFTRNPMYLGLTAILLGFALFFWSAVMVLAPIGFFLVMDRIVIPREEQALERTFGASYRDYQDRVHRWL